MMILGSDPEEAKAAVYMGLHKLHNLDTVKKIYSDQPSHYTKKSTDRIQLVHQVKSTLKLNMHGQ